ncbi:MAG TPA: hypothetical protein VNS79_13610 [Sphingobium sp.]|nr:hypothetical protein [Sphingobium sp.]
MSIFPRPVSPRSAFADLRDMFSRDRPHRWSLLALSAGLTGMLFWGFTLSSRLPDKPREIYYVQSWMADRKDSDIIRKQMADLDAYEAGLVKEQGKFQRLADSLGIEWREEEARNAAQRKAVIAAIHKRLQERLEAAEAGEGRAPADRAAAR